MVTITLPSELERAVAEEAAQKGTTAQRLTLDVLQERFLNPSSQRQLPDGTTLDDALAGCIEAINTRDKDADGSTLSENTGRKFAQVVLRDLIAVTYDWPKINRRRCRLIGREVEGTITEEEAGELKRLQGLADLRTDLLDPFNLDELERLHGEIAIGNND
jgi:hypothetical protein